MARQKTEEKYNYVLQYIDESVKARDGLRAVANRSINAYQGECYTNGYRTNLERYGRSINDKRRKEAFSTLCNTLPDKTNMTVFNAVETLVSMAMGGAGQFEFSPYDEYQEMDAEHIDMLVSAAEHFYTSNNMDSVMPQLVRMLALQGAGYFVIKPKDDGSFKITIVDAYKMLNDPYRGKRNTPRYRGWTQMESWSKVKKSIHQDEDNGYVLRALNEVDIYIGQIQDTINGDYEEINKPIPGLQNDISTFYPLYAKGDEKDKPKDPKDKVQYQGDDVECAYLYDHEADMYFKVINRRYIVLAQKNPLEATITCKYTDAKGKEKKREKKISIKDPIVEIPYIRTTWSTYPVSPLHYVLDDFDTICSIESVLAHNLSVMTPITFLGSSFDAEIISKAAQIAGEFVEGTMNQTGVFNKAHDMSPAITAITRYEEKIKRSLGATDQYELQAMIGNRATASEVSSIGGAVSQRLNQLFANIETGMAEGIQKMFTMRAIYSKDEEFSFSHKGGYAKMKTDQLAGDILIKTKLKSVIKLEQAEQSRNAMQFVGYLGQNPAIDQKQFLPDMIRIGLQNVVSRKQAESYITEEYKVDPIMVEAAGTAANNAKAKAAAKGPLGGVDLSGLTPEEVQALMANLDQAGQGVDPYAQGQVDVQGIPDNGATSPQSGPLVPDGIAPDFAGVEANRTGY